MKPSLKFSEPYTLDPKPQTKPLIPNSTNPGSNPEPRTPTRTQEGPPTPTPKKINGNLGSVSLGLANFSQVDGSGSVVQIRQL